MKREILTTEGSKVTLTTVKLAGKVPEVEIKIVGEEDAIVWIPASEFMAAAALIAVEYEMGAFDD